MGLGPHLIRISDPSAELLNFSTDTDWDLRVAEPVPSEARAC